MRIFELNLIRRILLTALLLPLAALTSSAQQKSGITFPIESLSKPHHLLPVTHDSNIWQQLIDQSRSGYPDDTALKYNIVAKSVHTRRLVFQGYHSFYGAVYSAYAAHRPLTLSPDMIWLLIAQGFAYHVNFNSEALRSMFVDFSGRQKLTIQNDKIHLNNPNSPWAEVFYGFDKQIARNVGADLTANLTADFSTTTQTSKIASQITLMNAMKSYFEFELQTTSCGIPEITLEGTPQDWGHLLNKAQALRKYKLDWWIDELVPVLKQFANASKGKINKRFWRSIYKVHSAKYCGQPSTVNGWVIKFYPYHKNGKRNNLKVWVNGGDRLTDEILKVDLNHIQTDGAGLATETPLELWAGFVGLEQDETTFGLKPAIGWMIRKKDGAETLLTALNKASAGGGALRLKISAVPPELFKIGSIKTLALNFTGAIDIPDQLAKINIGELALQGTIDKHSIKRIVKLFPNSRVIINREQYYPWSFDTTK